MVSNDLLLIPGKIEINIINFNDCNKIRKIEIPEADCGRGVCILNSNTLITCYNKTITQWKIEGNNLILISKKEEAYNYPITVVLNLENDCIAIASWDETIKIW